MVDRLLVPHNNQVQRTIALAAGFALTQGIVNVAHVLGKNPGRRGPERQRVRDASGAVGVDRGGRRARDRDECPGSDQSSEYRATRLAGPRAFPEEFPS